MLLTGRKKQFSSELSDLHVGNFYAFGLGPKGFDFGSILV